MQLIVCADSGFCRPKALRRFDAWGIDYIIGVAKNPVLEWYSALGAQALAEQYETTQTKQRLFGEFTYASRFWDRERRVIARLDHGEQGADPENPMALS